LKIIAPVLNLKRIALQNGNTLSFIRAPLNVASNFFLAFNKSQRRIPAGCIHLKSLASPKHLMKRIKWSPTIENTGFGK
jgi:hypothetical protein